MLISWLALGGALGATAVGQVSFKTYFVSRKRIFLALAIFLFICVPFCTYMALQQISLGMVYMSTAVTQLLVLALARLVLKEHLTRTHAVAMILILTGVILYSW